VLTGEVLCWLNSDDYTPGALEVVGGGEPATLSRSSAIVSEYRMTRVAQSSVRGIIGTG
jgi:hypothetical protein